MYFEPTKKTYYRFPSSNNINNLDLRYYFPEKTHNTGEDTRLENNYSQPFMNRDHHTNVF